MQPTDVVPSDNWGSLLSTVFDAIYTAAYGVVTLSAQIVLLTLEYDGVWLTTAKAVMLLLPVVVLIAAIWGTTLSFATIPFRSGRGDFLGSVLFSWWDAIRMTWFYWAGLVRFGIVLVGWVFGLIKFAFATLKSAISSPLAVLDWTSRKYFQPGVPWIAFFLVLFWSAVEATIFTFTLRPTMGELLADMTGYELNPVVLSTMLWLFLFPLIAGSFACIQVLNEAIRGRQIGQIVSMVLVELVVAMFEVLFLYRELVDAITPWLAQQGIILGVAGTLALAFGAWVGVRGMTWFLFGRYGTPALQAVLSRQTITRDESAPETAAPVKWKGPIEALKTDTAWFKAEAKEVFALLTLPVLQLLAAGFNFGTVLLAGRPMFSLPFRSLDDVMISTPMRAPTIHAQVQHQTPAHPQGRAS